MKALRYFIPVTDDYRGGKFFVRNLQDNSRLYATPLLVVLLVIETTDVLFAVDSIPAVLAITLNAFIVYTVERVRDSGTALAVFRRLAPDEGLPLPALWTGGRAGAGRR